MFLYNLISPFYDFFLRPLYRPYRSHVLEMLPLHAGAVVLDVACGTGQNFPYLYQRVGHKGRIIGVDSSGGMLRRAKAWIAEKTLDNVSVFKMDVQNLSPATLKAQTGLASVDFVICTYGFSAMPGDWEKAFHRSFSVLKSGGGYMIHDIYAEKRTMHVRAFELGTRAHLRRKTWFPLKRVSTDFHMEDVETSTRLFAGKLFVAYGTKP